ncbi:MAG: DMT family transporter [Arenicellales bacterium]|jgi:drug/metabolite transporter (DMT)-like permease|nr:DMT family transporter [Arenicellales bacterium]
MLLFSALVAGSFSLGHMIANEITPAALTALRFVIAAMILGVLVWRTCGVSRDDLAALWRYLLLGGLMGAYFILMFEGLKTASAVSVSAVFTLTPVLSAVFGYILLSQLVTSRIVVALGIGAVGALWVIFRADFDLILALDIGRGEGIYFLGCVAHAIYTPLVRKLNRGQSPIVFTFGTLLGALVLVLIYGFGDLVAMDYAGLRPIVWGTLIYLGVLASALSFLLIQYSTLHLPSSKVMAYTYLTPSWVILWELALRHPLPPLMVWLGVVVTILALCLLLRDESSR